MSESIAVNRTPELIAAEINNIKVMTRKIALYNSIEIGCRLVEAKSLVPHGEWGKWLEKSVDYSQSTANNLMRIYEEYGGDKLAIVGDNVNSQALGNLSYTQAIALLGVREEDREQFIKEHDIGNMSTRELQQAIKDREQALSKNKELELKLEAAEKEAKEKSILHKTVSESYNKLEKTNKGHYEQAEKLRKELDETRRQLSEAQASGNNEEAERLQESLEKTDGELTAAQVRIKELEQKLKDKPIEAVAAPIIERIPEDVQKELDELRKGQQSAGVLKFTVYFESLVKDFKELLAALAELKGTDPEAYERYKNAVSGLLGKMSERL